MSFDTTANHSMLANTNLSFAKSSDQSASPIDYQSISLKPVNDVHLVQSRIICTIGPASKSKQVLIKLLQAGMNTARLNFSHGTHSYHKDTLRNLKDALSETRKLCAILLDTKGPEIRTGSLEGDSSVSLVKGNMFKIYIDDRKSTTEECSVSYKKMLKTVTPGCSILLDDGLIDLKVEKINSDHIITRIMNSGELGSTKGVNIPGVHVDLPILTDRDRSDILFGIDQGVDFIAISFVRSPKDVLEVKKLIAQHPKASDIKLIAKIENQEGVKNFDPILESCDGIMVARGDLGVEIPIEKVALFQKMFITKCNIAGKISIVATQMLESMVLNPRPTRAEANDVTNAIFDGSDCVMLSGETAKGNYPVKSVSIMAKICREAEHLLNHKAFFQFMIANSQGKIPVVEAIAIASVRTAHSLKASLIVAPTNTGRTAQLLAKYRPSVPILVLTSNQQTARQCLAYRGLFPMIVGTLIGTDAIISRAIAKAKQIGLCKKGDLIVSTSGIRDGVTGLTNLLKVVTVS